MGRAIAAVVGLGVLVVGIVLLTSGQPPADVQSAMKDANAVTPPAKRDDSARPPAAGEGGEPASFALNEDTAIEFTGYKIGGSQTLTFFDFEGGITLTGERLDTAVIRVTVPLDSLVHESSQFVEIMKGPDFFDVANHPEATFESRSVRENGDAYRVDGDLTLRGITRPISFEAEMTLAGDRFRLATRFKVDRQAWKITYKGRGDALIRDEVLMDITIVADRVE